MVLKPLIVFSGPDGSGKTTLGSSIVYIFNKNQNMKAKIVRMRGSHTFAYIIVLLLKVFGYKGCELHFYDLNIPPSFKKYWLYIEFFSVLPLIFFQYFILRFFYVIVAERSILDVLIWNLSGVKLKIEQMLRSTSFKLFLYLILKYPPIIITADINDLVKRKPNEKFLIIKMVKYYEIFGKVLNLHLINTSKTNFIASQKIIIKLIGKR